VNSKHMSRLLLLVLFLCSLRLAPVYSSESGSFSDKHKDIVSDASEYLIHEDWLYFVHYQGRNQPHIYRMDLEGNYLTTINTSPKYDLRNMFIRQEILYYVDCFSLWSIDLMTLSLKEIPVFWNDHITEIKGAYPHNEGVLAYIGVPPYMPNKPSDYIVFMNYEGEVLWEIYPGRADNLNLDGEYLYFTDREKDDKLLRCKLDGSDLVEITQKAVDKVMVHQGWIYFTFTDSLGRLSKMKVNEYKAITLPPRLVQQYHICKDWLFFSGFMPNENHIPQSLYKMRIDESEMIRINDFPSTDIHVYDDKVFYRKAVDHNSKGLWMYNVSQKRHVRLDEAPTDLLPFELETISFEASSEPEEIETPANDETLQMENDTLPPQKPPVSPWPVLFFLIPAVILAGIWGILVVKKRKP